jgi:hypothetical protein
VTTENPAVLVLLFSSRNESVRLFGRPVINPVVQIRVKVFHRSSFLFDYVIVYKTSCGEYQEFWKWDRMEECQTGGKSPGVSLGGAVHGPLLHGAARHSGVEE